MRVKMEWWGKGQWVLERMSFGSRGVGVHWAEASCTHCPGAVWLPVRILGKLAGPDWIIEVTIKFVF